MVDIASNLNTLRKLLPTEVCLVAVSKTKPASDLLIAYNLGQRIFGENRIQELLIKKDKLPDDIEWHFIGHLQTNKVKFIVPFISLIQSVDSVKLLKTINSEAYKNGRKVDCLLQLHIATEETKFGFNADEVHAFLKSDEYKTLNNIRVCGMMGMATFTEDDGLIKKEFSYLAKQFFEIKKTYFLDKTSFKELSMGMSGDYKIALAEGSTMIRLGSSVFGERQKASL